MRIAVLGAGSLGQIIGALIAERGYDVELLDTNREHVAALNEHGARITGFLDRTIPVRASHPEDAEGEYDLVILLVKQLYTQPALASLDGRLHAKTIVCTLQNGMPEEGVASIVGRERTVGGAVGFGATWEGPGVSRLTSTLETVRKHAFDVGELDGSTSTRIQQVREVLSSVGHCQVVDNITGMKWSKLLMNATFSGMSAALNCTFGDVLDSPDAMAALAQIADETIKVGRAADIRMAPMQGVDLSDLELSPGETFEDKMPLFRQVWNPHRELTASMLQDLEKGRRTEIEQINGVVCAKGREFGVPTPYNDLVVQLVREVEQGDAPHTFARNIEQFLALNVSS